MNEIRTWKKVSMPMSKTVGYAEELLKECRSKGFAIRNKGFNTSTKRYCLEILCASKELESLKTNFKEIQ